MITTPGCDCSGRRDTGASTRRGARGGATARQAIWLGMFVLFVLAIVFLFATPVEDDEGGQWTPATAAPAVPTDVP